MTGRHRDRIEAEAGALDEVSIRRRQEADPGATLFELRRRPLVDRRPWPASASRHPAVRPPSDPPTTAMSMLTDRWIRAGRTWRSGRSCTRTALAARRSTDRAARTGRVAGVLRPDLVEMRGDPLALRPVVLGDLARHGVLDAHPVIRVRRVDQQARQSWVVADPSGLGAVRRAVDEDHVAFVVEPHRGEVGPAAGPDDAEHLCDRVVHQLLERRIQLGERLDRERSPTANCPAWVPAETSRNLATLMVNVLPP